MPKNIPKTSEALDLLRSIPLEETIEEKVDTLWRQLMVYKSFSDSDKSEAQARRAQAETAREQAETEVVRATAALCDRMRAEADRELQEATRLREEVEREREKLESDIRRAGDFAADTKTEADRIAAAANVSAQELLDEARATAEQESTQLRRQAIKEIRDILRRVEGMKDAIGEELETQRVLTGVAKLKSSTLWAPTDEDIDGTDPAPPEVAKEVVASLTDGGNGTEAGAAEESADNGRKSTTRTRTPRKA